MASNPGRKLSTDRPEVKRPRVGLVLAGGGVAGYAFHCGVLFALHHQTGWDPDSAELVLGTSSGSIVAAGLRAGLSTEEMRQRAVVAATQPMAGGAEPRHLEEMVGVASFRFPDLQGGPSALSLVTSELRRGHRLRPSHLLTGLLPEGRTPTSPVGDAIRPLHPNGWPDRDLWITTTEQQTGIRRVFGRDDDSPLIEVAQAVEASCAVPGYFAPVVVDGVSLVDGGIHSPDNTDLLIGQDLDIVIVSSPLSIDSVRFGRSPLASLLRAYPRRRLTTNAANLREAGTEVLVIEPDRNLGRAMGLNAMATNRVEAVIEAAEVFLGRWLDQLDDDDQALLSELSPEQRRSHQYPG
ncbi:MAG: patatin-like phospholipase family protein [Actinomycetia bacterium]|nr:patatin-like phospholipase family protein [Actinomycetes bacterium]